MVQIQRIQWRITCHAELQLQWSPRRDASHPESMKSKAAPSRTPPRPQLSGELLTWAKVLMHPLSGSMGGSTIGTSRGAVVLEAPPLFGCTAAGFTWSDVGLDWDQRGLRLPRTHACVHVHVHMLGDGGDRAMREPSRHLCERVLEILPWTRAIPIDRG